MVTTYARSIDPQKASDVADMLCHTRKTSDRHYQMHVQMKVQQSHNISDKLPSHFIVSAYDNVQCLFLWQNVFGFSVSRSVKHLTGCSRRKRRCRSRRHPAPAFQTWCHRHLQVYRRRSLALNPTRRRCRYVTMLVCTLKE